MCIYRAVAVHIQQTHVMLATGRQLRRKYIHCTVTVARIRTICHSANETTPHTKNTKESRTAWTILKQSQKLRTLSWGSTLVIITKSCTGLTPKMTQRKPLRRGKGSTHKTIRLKHSGFEQFKTYAAYGHTKCRIRIAVHLRHQPKPDSEIVRRKESFHIS